MLVDKDLLNLYTQYTRHSIYSKDSIKQALYPWARDHLLLAQVCVLISTLYNIEKRKALKVLLREDWQILDVLKRPDATLPDLVKCFLSRCIVQKHAQ